MPRRASLPGAEELFRRTSSQRTRGERAESKQVDKTPNLQVAQETGEDAGRKGPRHEEKITFYCTSEDLMSLERARLKLRAEHGVAADRGRIVRAALAYVLEDFDARSSDSLLLRRLTE